MCLRNNCGERENFKALTLSVEAEVSAQVPAGVKGFSAFCLRGDY
jgi:hypothetical protein